MEFFFVYSTVERLVIKTLDHIYYLRRFVEQAGTTSTIQEVMILFNITLGELFWEIIAVGEQKIST
jgi:hypothetical protein